MKARSDPNQRWCQNHATPEEFLAAFKSYTDTQWGLPTFSIIRFLIEARRSAEVIRRTA